MSSGKITVVGLGPAGAELLTVETVELLHSGAPVWLRTSRHPAAAGLDIAGSFDSLYETLDSFEEVYSSIVAELIDLARGGGSVVYAVPGSPSVAEHTVELLRVHDAVSSREITLDVRPAMAFTDLCWGALGIDPMAEAVTIIDALTLSVQGAGRIGPLLITQVHSREVLEEVISILDDVAPETVTVLQGLGTTDALVAEMPWEDLRGTLEPDHLTSLWIPRLAESLAESLLRLEDAVRSVQNESPEALPRTLAFLRSAFPTATDSVVAAIDDLIAGSQDAQFDAEEGLADLLYLTVLHTRLAAEAGYFTIENLAQTAVERHSNT